jgi:hypothetical protein
LTELGQHRVDSFGCPHCDNRDIVRWGRASDLPRYLQILQADVQCADEAAHLSFMRKIRQRRAAARTPAAILAELKMQRQAWRVTCA